MPGNGGSAGWWSRLFGEKQAPAPSAAWLAIRDKATPEEVIRQHFAAMAAHDLDLILATLALERARLYNEPRTVDRRRLTIAQASVRAAKPWPEPVQVPAFVHRYRSMMVLRVEYELELVEQEQRRDPTLREGSDWAYYVLVTEGRGRPWLIADWGR